MTSEMVERVARAIAKEARAPDDLAWRLYANYARSAIEAMREPTLDMMQAGRSEYLRTHRGGVSGMTIEAQIRNECIREAAAYRAMVGAALKGEA